MILRRPVDVEDRNCAFLSTVTGTKTFLARTRLGLGLAQTPRFRSEADLTQAHKRSLADSEDVNPA